MENQKLYKYSCKIIHKPDGEIFKSHFMTTESFDTPSQLLAYAKKMMESESFKLHSITKVERVLLEATCCSTWEV